MNAPPPRIPPRQVPVLTEVIDVLDLRDDLDASPEDLQVAAVVTPAAPAFEPTHAAARQPAEPYPASHQASHYLSHPQAAAAEVPPALSALLEQPPVFPGQVEYLGQIGHVEPYVQAPANDGQGPWAPDAPAADAQAPVSYPPAPESAPVDAAASPLAADAAPAAAAEQPADEQLTQRVLHEVQRHIDLMLEYRLRQVLGPILARAADGIVKDARQDLAATLRDVVARAVAQEIARQRGK